MITSILDEHAEFVLNLAATNIVLLVGRYGGGISEYQERKAMMIIMYL